MLILLVSLIVFGLGFAAAILISSKSDYVMQNVFFFEGVVLTLLGIVLFMKGNSFAIDFRGVGQKTAQHITYQSLEARRISEKIDKDGGRYYKNIAGNADIRIESVNFILLISGIAMAVYSMITIQ
jgi:hypothetical protein